MRFLVRKSFLRKNLVKNAERVFTEKFDDGNSNVRVLLIDNGTVGIEARKNDQFNSCSIDILSFLISVHSI